jgi:hypothetical protein
MGDVDMNHSSSARRRTGHRWPLLAIVVAACTYNPRFEDCRVISCDGLSDCPSGYTCDQQHFCRAPNAEKATSCVDVLADAAMSSGDSSSGKDSAGGGSGSESCGGTATGCTSMSSQSTCNAQSGCSWTATAECKLTIVDCSQYTVSNCPGSYCTTQPGYCTDNPYQCKNVTTKSVCDGRSQCTWIPAGCDGTATSCASITSSAPCMVHAGCAWE